MRKGALLLAACAAFVASEPYSLTAMPATATMAPAAVAPDVQQIEYYDWGYYRPQYFYELPDRYYGYVGPYRPPGVFGAGAYRPRYEYFNYYQTYGCNYYADEYCVYGRWSPALIPGW